MLERLRTMWPFHRPSPDPIQETPGSGLVDLPPELLARRHSTEIAEARRNIVRALLPILDDLERARAHNDLPQGLLRITAQFRQALADAGMEVISPETDERFNPELHEAVSMQNSGAGKLIVIQTIRDGYIDRRANLLIHPAFVVVGRTG